MAIAEWLLRTLVQSFTILQAIPVVGIPFPVMASVEKSNANQEIEPLQTEITHRDLKIIEQLITIAQRNSASVQETKAAMGLSAFEGVVTIELSPSQTTTNFTSPDVSSEQERSFSFAVIIDPIKLLSTFEKLPIMQARWHEAKYQKRVAVMQYYVAYLQARQAAKIAAYRMQKFTGVERVASLHSQATSPQVLNHLANPDYVAAATEMLMTNARERVALEELAASVGLSSKATMAVINGQ